jgi:hypothetical protein
VRKQKGQKGLQTKVRKWGKLTNFPEYLFVQTIVEIKSFATESFYNKITVAETLEATRQFDEENVLSRGRYGLLFKALFQDGMVLAIRRLPDGSIFFLKSIEN